MIQKDEVHEAVRETYAAAARVSLATMGTGGCCGPATATATATDAATASATDAAIGTASTCCDEGTTV